MDITTTLEVLLGRLARIIVPNMVAVTPMLRV